MATEQDVDLVIVESPSARSGDEVLRSVLGSSPCDVCVLAGDGMLAAVFPFVPFAGAEHVPPLVVRRGARPGGLAPPAEMTRFTWTVAPTTG